MATTLEGLPFDIKFAILGTFLDYDSVISLAVASRSFRQVLRDHKDALLTHAFFVEASEYQKESFLLARIDGTLKCQPVPEDFIIDVADLYIEDLKGIKNEDPWYYQYVYTGGRDTKLEIARNHMRIRNLTEQFIATQMYPRLLLGNKAKLEKRKRYNRPIATAAERSRIIRGYYRLWVIKLFYYADVTKSNGPKSWYFDMVLQSIFSCWSFWEIGVINMLLTDLKLQSTRGLLHLHEHCRLFENMFPKKPMRTEWHYDIYVKRSFTILFASNFPHENMNLINHQKFPPRAQILQDLAVSIHKHQTILRQLQGRGEIHGWILYYFLEQFKAPNRAVDAVELRRVCKMGGKPYWKKNFYTEVDYNAAKKQWVDRLFLELDSCSDTWAGVWDDWRLKEWGYCFPELQKGMHEKEEREGCVRETKERVRGKRLMRAIAAQIGGQAG